MMRPGEQPPSVRSERIQQIVDEVQRRRSSGERIDDEQIIAVHTALMPQLAEKLKKLRRIEHARAQALEQVAGTSSGEDEVSGMLQTMDLQAGTHLGPYEILKQVGAGGMGQVYRARDIRLQRLVAVKILPRRLASDVEALNRFEREARATAAMSHPNILAIYDIGSERGVTFAVSELLEGESLRHIIRSGPVDWRKAVEIAGDIAAGLTAAHAKGVVHRDIKPENLFVTSAGVVKILDFGLARRESPIQEGEPEATPTATLVTRPGSLIGTLHYMSPEQIRGRETDARSDIFALGGVLYEMLAGRRAFERDSPADTMAAILSADPPELTREIPAELQRCVGQCLKKHPDQRFQSAHDLAIALKKVLHDSRALLLPRSILRAAPVVLALLAAVAWLMIDGLRERPLQGQINSLAVLPFTISSSDPELEALSEGITERLISRLWHIPDVKIISMNSVLQYKDRAVDPVTVGTELQVGAVLMGRISRRDGRVSISVELVNARDNAVMWGEHLDQRASDLFIIEERVPEHVSNVLHLRLSRAQQQRLTRRLTQNGEAYGVYLKGRYWWNKRTNEGLRKGLQYFQQAADIDPTYAPAHAGIAESYIVMAGANMVPPGEAMPRARAAAMRALQLDDTLGEAHASLGDVKSYFDWDWAGAESDYRRAIALKPGYATAHQWYADYLAKMGRQDEALDRIQKARELDPLSRIINLDLAYSLYCARRHDEAMKQLRSMIGMDPDYPSAHWLLGCVYAQRDMYPEAIAACRTAVDLSKRSPLFLAWLGQALAMAGHDEQARDILEELARLAEGGEYVSPFAVASVYTGLGELDQAFQWLERAYEERNLLLANIKVDPGFDPLRGDPRFEDLLRRMGLEPV